MASLFDEIFNLPGDAFVNPLFSSNNKFKSAKVAESLASLKPAVKADGEDQDAVDIPAPVKVKKTSNKRKVAEPTAPQHSTETGHKRSKVASSSHTKHKPSAPGIQSKQDTPAPAQEAHLRKRKRQDVKPSQAAQPSLAAVNSTVDDHEEVSEDASAAAHETATQVHYTMRACTFCSSCCIM